MYFYMFAKCFHCRIMVITVCLSALLFLTAGCAGRHAEPVMEDYRVEDNAADTDAALSGGSSGSSGSSFGSTAGSADAEGGQPGALDADGNLSGSASGTGEKASEKEGGTAVLAQPLTVHVCGAVKQEGVYELPSGSRILDAVEAAGGFSKEADTAYLNLAQPAEDGRQVRVPSREEAQALRGGASPAEVFGEGSAAAAGGLYGTEPASNNNGENYVSASDAGAGAADGKKININTASMQELMQIPGIGETKAGRIIAYREENGGFSSVEELMKVSGIGEASFNKIREYVTV